MNTYPGIYRAACGREYLYLDKSNYLSFERGIWDKSDSADNHEDDTNITREYLEDTKVKIESEEHRRFIQDLIGNVPTGFWTTVTDGYLYIMTQPGNQDSCREITLPLPPKKPEPKEWPVVGDEVLTASNTKAIVLGFHDNQVWIKYTERNREYNTVSIAQLKKPLTPEEELAKELEKMVYDGMDNSYDLNHNCYYLVSGLMKKYDIKKKPE